MMRTINSDGYHRFCMAVALAAAAVGVYVLLGWTLNVSVMVRLFPAMTVIKPDTALCFLLSGMALWLSVGGNKVWPKSERRANWIRIIATITVMVLSAVTIGEIFLQKETGITLLLFHNKLLAMHVPHPGQMAMATALGFFVFGCAMLLLDWGIGRFRPAQLLAIVLTMIGFMALVFYFYGAKLLGGTGNPGTALHTPTLFLFMGLAIFAARPRHGLMAVFSNHRLGGVMARRLLPVLVCLPILVGWFRLRGQQAALYQPEVGSALFTCGYVLILSAVVWICAVWLNHADAARRIAEERDEELAAIVDSSSEAILGKTLDGIITSWNRGAEQVYGYSAEEVIGKSISILVPPSLGDEIPRFLETVRKGGAIHNYESLRQRKDGVLIHVELTVSPVRNREGTIIAASTVARDITDQKMAEEQLAESQRALREQASVLELAQVLVRDRNDRIEMWTLGAQKLYGFSRGEALGRISHELLKTVFPEPLQNIRANLLNAGTWEGELVHTKRDGSRVVVASVWILERDAQGRPLRTLESNTDITERKRAEEALQLAQVRLVSALEGSRMGTWVWDIAHGKVDWDEGLFALFGRSPDELLHGSIEPFFSWLHPQDRERTRIGIEEILREGTHYDAEYRLFRPDHSVVWIATRGRVERDDQGKAFRMTGVCIDITDRKKIEEQLLQSQKVQALGTLAGGIAHDFNNILLAIGGNASLAMEDLPPGHPAQASLQEIAKAGVRASNLVRQILTFSRRQTPDRKSVEVRPVVEEAIALLRSTLPAQIEIRTVYGSDLPSVSANATQLHQVIMNLGTNAARAIGENPGVLEISARPFKAMTDFAAGDFKLRAGEYVRISVRDNGCGMDAATMKRIFDPFFTTQPPGQGTGLGLSVVHGIMKDHEGAVSVYSELGKGTVFHIHLPASSQKAEKKITGPAIPQGHGERLLYVDDEETLVLLAKRSLTRLGYQVTGYTNPALALQDFTSNPHEFDAVVTDLSMPGISGATLAREIIKIRSDIPIVMMSGYIRPEDEEEAERIGVHDVILKPDTIDELAKSLHQAFRDTNSGRSADPERN